MAIARPDRSEFNVHIGQQTRTLTYRSAAAAALEERLDSDPLAYIAAGKGQTRFIVEALIVGLPKGKDAEIITPPRVHKWLDDDAAFDREGFVQAVLFAIARGKPGAEGKRMVKVLDEVFAEEAQKDDHVPTP